ncbi:hypothetical protein HanPSC8_Chr07g0271321 [Helianthus annuus]|nr:hypothetical protein HanPSC8_Chr07g0271321 [Helianthus annuus]
MTLWLRVATTVSKPPLKIMRLRVATTISTNDVMVASRNYGLD